VIAAWGLEQREQRRRAARNAGVLEATVRERTAELERRNRGMRLVLDNLQQGLVTVDTHGVMAAERSAVVDHWFGTPEAGQSLPSYIARHAPAFGEALELGLEQLRDDLLPRDMLLEQLPRRFYADARVFEVSYGSIGEAERIERLLVVITDVTAATERAELELEQRETVQMFQHLMRDRAGFLEFSEEARELASSLAHTGIDDAVAVKRVLHTLKGNAAIFGMDSLAEFCHALESDLDERGGPLGALERAELERRLERFARKLAALLGEGVRRTLDVDMAEYDETLRAALCGESPQKLAHRLSAFGLEPAARRLQRVADQAERIARRLNKGGIDVTVLDGGVRLEPSRWASFWAAFVHVVRNAVDHGIEPAAERARSGKSLSGRLEIATRVANDRFVIELSDDGRGVDWQAIGERARVAGLPHTTEAELMEALFADGISTAPYVSELSGRGVGMGALRSETLARGGRMNVTTLFGRGTRVEFDFPLAAMSSDATSCVVAA
jgi:two-component system chemotaxis sensor kinase CheA